MQNVSSTCCISVNREVWGRRRGDGWGAGVECGGYDFRDDLLVSFGQVDAWPTYERRTTA